MVTSNTAERLVMGTQHDSEFLDMDGDRVHIFDCFALVNRLLCAAHLWGTSTGDPTKPMFTNCERHFEATLQILEPTIVVIQGVKVWKRCRNVLIPRKALSKHLIECELDDRRVLVAPLTHPSARHPHRWDSPTSAYFKEVVRPTLRRATMLAS
jgi:uracil-DNA glycosylase